MEIVHGIHTIPTGSDYLLGPFTPQVYLITSGDGALIDSGYGDQKSVSAIVDYVNNFHELNISHIFITHAHPDHINGAIKIRENTGARIVLHTAEPTDIVIDKLVHDSDTISFNGVELEIVHTPGHNPGHICLYMREEKILFSGDHVLGMGTTVIMPPHGDMTQYINSLRKLLSYDIELICPGHGSPIKDPRSKIEELIDHRLERESQIIKCLLHGKTSINELASEIYPELNGFLYKLAKGQVYAHLLKLESEGHIYSQKRNSITYYKLTDQRERYVNSISTNDRS